MTDNNKIVSELRKETANKSCFDCGEKGVNYVVLDFGIFVCNTCSGIHRELTHKVKGMGMSNFTDKDVAQIEKWGNAAAKKYWMAGYNKTLYPIPDRRDVVKMKEFMKMKYVQKRFLEENADDSSEDEDESDDSDDKKKKKKKKAKKTKKTKKKKKEVSSEEEEDSDESEEEEQKEDPKKNRVKQQNSSKASLGNPPSKLGKPTNTTLQSAKSETRAVKKEQPKVDNSNILDFEFDTPTETVAPGQPNQKDDNSWADFAFGGQPPQQPSQGSNDLWGAFDTSKVNEKKTTDLLSSLGDLYGKASQQYNQYPQYPQPNMTQPNFQGGYQNTGFGSQYPATQAPQPSMSMTGDDPFASAIHEQQKQHYEQLQKSQAEKLAQNLYKNSPSTQPGAPATGVTPNMFFQQMMQMMQNSGQSNPSQAAMMMATMQQMMNAMTLNNQNSQQNTPQETAPSPPPPTQPAPDPSKGMFKNLVNNAASSLSSGGARHSDLGSKPQPTQSNAFNPFGAPAASSTNTRTSEPSNPFGSFGFDSAPTPQTTTQNSMFNTQFSNSGFSGGQPSSQNHSTPAASSNPFDMFK
jgi:hypothetical protein